MKTFPSRGFIAIRTYFVAVELAVACLFLTPVRATTKLPDRIDLVLPKCGIYEATGQVFSTKEGFVTFTLFPKSPRALGIFITNPSQKMRYFSGRNIQAKIRIRTKKAPYRATIIEGNIRRIPSFFQTNPRLIRGEKCK